MLGATPQMEKDLPMNSHKMGILIKINDKFRSRLIYCPATKPPPRRVISTRTWRPSWRLSRTVNSRTWRRSEWRSCRPTRAPIRNQFCSNWLYSICCSVGSLWCSSCWSTYSWSIWSNYLNTCNTLSRDLWWSNTPPISGWSRLST